MIEVRWVLSHRKRVWHAIAFQHTSENQNVFTKTKCKSRVVNAPETDNPKGKTCNACVDAVVKEIQQQQQGGTASERSDHR